LAGFNLGTISSSVANVAVTGNWAGGIVGQNSGAISNAVATGAVSATSGPSQTPRAGGLVGANAGLGTVSGSYATGAVTGVSGTFLGGAMGTDDSISGNSFVYWDVTSSGQNTGCHGACNGITGLTTEQLQSGLPAGFKRTIWTEKQSVADGLPSLRTARQK
jgi:hypothetical protein